MRLPEGVTTRALRPEDAAEVCALMMAAETADVGEPFVDLPNLVGHWRRSSFDLATQTVGVVDGLLSRGPLVGYAEVSDGRYADVVVPPPHRGRGIGTALARWTQDEARRQGGAQVGMAVPLGSPGDALLTALGYRVAWTSWILALPEGAQVAPQPLPDGFSVRGMRAGAGRGQDERAAYRVVEDAFGEWPDRRSQTFEDWAARTVQRPGSDAEHLRLAVDAQDEVVGVSVLSVSHGVGVVDNLAVRRDHRGRGLARALLADSFAVTRRQGATRSELSTDSRTGALGLYERVGMVVTSTWLHRVAVFSA
ncbi:MAG: GNAT family N-acetyltransferase, partial [Lapillicoccus sp.]